MGISVEPPGPSDPVTPTPSLVSKSSATGPGALANLALINAPPAGVYRVDIYIEYSGTMAAVDQDNIRLQVDNVSITTLQASAAITSGDVNPVQTLVVRTTGTNIKLQSIAAATATAIYGTMIVATLVG